MASKVSITLEPRETLAMAQFIRYLVPDERHPHISRRFLLDFGLVFLHHVSENGHTLDDAQPAEIALSEEDLLSLRELVPVTATVGGALVGLTIHKKLFEALLRYHPEQATELRFSDIEEPSKEEFTVELQRLKRRNRRNQR